MAFAFVFAVAFLIVIPAGNLLLLLLLLLRLPSLFWLSFRGAAEEPASSRSSPDAAIKPEEKLLTIKLSGTQLSVPQPTGPSHWGSIANQEL
jgi:hypothetical protein